MIIGINGKIGSGKDTIGSIIQYLTDENVKGMSFEDWYASNVYSVYQATGKWEIKKFAGKLKTTASLLTGIPVEKFEDQEFKKTNLGPEWDTELEYIIPMTVRELLQKLGTEAMRDGLHTNVWVNALFADYRSEHKKDKQISLVDVSFDKSTLPNWIITDMRFPNELEAIVKRGGITIRVVRPGFMIDGKAIVKDLHPSETSLDNAKFDYEIINDGTIEDLIEKVREILIREDIL